MAWRTALRLVPALVLIGAGASATDYQILHGTITGSDGAREALTGRFEAGPFILLEYVPDRRTLFVGGFELRAGDRTFTPAGGVMFDGPRTLVVLPPPHQIHLTGNHVEQVLLRSGGEVIRSDEFSVTLRYVDFRSDESDGGSAVGLLRDGRMPRRLDLAGTLVEVEQSFEIPRYVCLPVFEPISLITEPVSSPSGDVSVVAVGGVGETPLSDEPRGSVSIRGDGGRLIPTDVSFRIVIVPPLPIPICSSGLLPIDPPVEHEMGRFDLVATAARPIDIDVKPAQSTNVVLPGSPERVPVAILGAEGLDVRDIDETSLRLGPDEAEPAPWPGREWTRRRDVDRDGLLDLVARFAARDTGIALGDHLICLVAQTYAGHVLEGCDAIRTLPGR